MARKKRRSIRQRTGVKVEAMPKEDIRAIDDPFALTKSVYIHDAPAPERLKRYHVKKYSSK